MSQLKTSIEGKITMPAKPLIINDLGYSIELSDEELTSCSGGAFSLDLLSWLLPPIPGSSVTVGLGTPLTSPTITTLGADGSIRCTNNWVPT